KARVYVAGAIDDASFPDDMKARLEQALTAAGVNHVIETYPARHGFVLRDTPVVRRRRAGAALADVDAATRPIFRGSLRERSLIERILRVYVVRADVRVGAAFVQPDRETETDPVAHVLHVTRGAGLHPTPFVTEAACLEPEL